MKLALWRIVRAATFTLVAALALIVVLNAAAGQVEVFAIDVVLLAANYGTFLYSNRRVRALTQAHSVR